MASLSAALTLRRKREIGWFEANKENIPPAPSSDGEDNTLKAAGAAPALETRASTPTLDAPLPPAPADEAAEASPRSVLDLLSVMSALSVSPAKSFAASPPKKQPLAANKKRV